MSKRRRRHPRPVVFTAEAHRALDELYAQLPDIECRGSCWDSCGSIAMSSIEHERVAAAGVDIPDSYTSRDGPSVCPALTMLHQCAVYDARPLICRAWGLTESMPCTFGCVPDGGHLSDQQFYEFMAQVCDIAGAHDEAEQIRQPWRDHPERAAELMTQWRRMIAEQQLAEDLRRRRAIDSGTGLFVRGRGHVSSRPPERGANSA